MRWWWFGPTVTKAGLEREMRLMKDGGIGGFEIQPVYPARPRRSRPRASRRTRSCRTRSSTTCDSPPRRRRELGLRVDLTLGSGWPYGGPQVGIAPGRRQAADRARAGARRRRARPGARHPRRRAADGGVPRAVGARRRRRTACARSPTSPTACCACRTARRSAREVAVLHQQPHRHDGEAPGRRRRGLRPQPLRPRRRRPLPARPSATACCRPSTRRRRTPSSATASRCTSPTGPTTSSTSSRRAAATTCGRSCPRSSSTPGRRPPRIRHDWGQTLTELVDERFLAPMQEWARQPRHAVPHPGLRHPAGHDLEQRRRRPARRRRRAVEDAARVALGRLDRPPLRPARHLVGDLDVAALARLHGDAARREGGGRPALPPGHQPAHRPRLALHGRRRRVSRAGASTRPGVFNEKNPWWIVMPDVARYLQRVSFLLRQGQPVERRRVLPAERRRLGALRAREGRRASSRR